MSVAAGVVRQCCFESACIVQPKAIKTREMSQSAKDGTGKIGMSLQPSHFPMRIVVHYTFPSYGSSAGGEPKDATIFLIIITPRDLSRRISPPFIRMYLIILRRWHVPRNRIVFAVSVIADTSFLRIGSGFNAAGGNMPINERLRNLPQRALPDSSTATTKVNSRLFVRRFYRVHRFWFCRGTKSEREIN